MIERNPLIDIQLQDHLTGSGASDILISVYIEAYERNHYPLGYFITDKIGCVKLDRKQLRKIVQAEMVDSPMDYSQGWEDCNYLLIDVPSPLEIQRRLTALKETYPEYADKLQNLLKRASNKCIASNLSFRVKLGEPTVLQVKLKPE